MNLHVGMIELQARLVLLNDERFWSSNANAFGLKNEPISSAIYWIFRQKIILINFSIHQWWLKTGAHPPTYIKIHPYIISVANKEWSMWVYRH